MLNTLHALSNKLLSLAEFALWGFVAIGVIDMLYGGVYGPSSVAIACYVILSLGAVFVMFITAICKLFKKG